MTGNEFLMQLETLYADAQEVLTAFAAKQSELVADRTVRAVSMQYARGGKILHRGYFCPNPVMDIVHGNVNRGRLVRNSIKEPDFTYYFDDAGNLLGYDRYEYGETVNGFIRNYKNVEWEFYYMYGEINELYATKYCGKHVLYDAFVPSSSGIVSRDGIYKAWVFDYNDNKLHTAEYITDTIDRNAYVKLEILKSAAFIDRVLYEFETNAKGKLIKTGRYQYDDTMGNY